MLFFKKEFIFIFLFLIYHCYSYAVFPFKSYNKCDINKNVPLNNINDISNIFIQNCLTNTIYSEVDFGEPKQTVNIILSMKGSSFYLFEGFCPNNISTFYDSNKSTTFKNSSFCTNNFNNINLICDIKEKITFYNDINLKSNSSIKELNIAYGKGLPSYIRNTNINNICGYLGFSLMNKDISNLSDRFLLFLRFFKVIKEYIWTFHFFDKNNKNDLFYKINNKINDNYEGLLIIGMLPHIYDIHNFNENNYKSALDESRGYIYKWELKFFDIYFFDNNNNKIKINNYFQGELDIETNYIISTKEYFNLIKDNFFNTYLNKKICINETVEIGKHFYSLNNNFYEIISCDINYFGDKEMKKFPTLYFFHLKYNFTFSFNYKELFLNIYNKQIFLITTSKSNEEFWTFGKLFMKKYQFIFNTEKKTINFYADKKIYNANYPRNSKTSRLKLVIFFLIVIILSIIIGIYIGKKLYKKKKKIVYELKNDYKSNSIDNEIINKNIEMKIKLVF